MCLWRLSWLSGEAGLLLALPTLAILYAFGPGSDVVLGRVVIGAMGLVGSLALSVASGMRRGALEKGMFGKRPAHQPPCRYPEELPPGQYQKTP